ncbi:MAG: hypothetical protein WAV56_00630 [Microgenomates group bacterium]
MAKISNKLHHLAGLTLILSLFLPVETVLASELSSESYIIKMGTINIGSGTKTSTAIKLTDTVGQTLQGEFAGTGYRTRVGFQYLPTTEPFSLTISATAVDFGTVKPAAFAGNSLDLTVNGAGVHGYSVSAIEDHPLTAKPNVTIPDTACDPSDKCTPTHAGPWTSSMVYGFGYNLSGTDAEAEFADATYFRPFANNAANQNPVVIMSRQGKGEKAVAKLTFRINVPPAQSSGAYQNTIQFIALPSF